MTTQVTLALPDDLYKNAQHWATITEQNLTETLTNALKIILTPVYIEPEPQVPVSALSNIEVLTLSQVRMKPLQGVRLGKLLEKQREESLTIPEQNEIIALLQVYNQLWIRQSEALAEAVRRGLRAPLES